MRYFDHLTPANRWDACADFPVEFLTAARIISEYVAEDDKLLDLEGDVGRFAMYFADMGCNVTLADSSVAATEFAKFKAESASTKLSAVAGNIRAVDGKFNTVIARFGMGDLSTLLASVSEKLESDGTLILWVMSQAYDMQKLLDICPKDLPTELIPTDTAALFVDCKTVSDILTENGFAVMRKFSPSGALPHTDRALINCSDEAFVRLMNLSMAACESPQIVEASSCVVFICRKQN
ncbi:MAG: class I SAM-dependent methyltransferase [Ruminococcaceae bacterium]|nr:class I SAM-dependent methyltransferase [Oscillospiraceae bacterium]